MSFTGGNPGSFSSGGLWGGPSPTTNPFQTNPKSTQAAPPNLFASTTLSSSLGLNPSPISTGFSRPQCSPVTLTPQLNTALEKFIEELAASLATPESPPIPDHLPSYVIAQVIESFHMSPTPTDLDCYDELQELITEYLGGSGGSDVLDKVFKWIQTSQEEGGASTLLAPPKSTFEGAGSKLTGNAREFTPLGSANAFSVEHQQHAHIPGNATPPIGITPSYNANAAPFVYGGVTNDAPVVDMGEDAFPSLSSSIGKEAFPALGSSAGSGGSKSSSKRSKNPAVLSSIEDDLNPKPPTTEGRPPIPPSRERKASNAGSSPGSDLASSLAASLFSSTTRPRSNSSIQSSSPKSPVLDAVDPESFVSPSLLPSGWFSLPHGISTATPALPSATQTKVNNILPYLHSLHPTISQPALQLSLTLARGNIPLASYLLDRAGSLPPICRHLLSGGCYRSDCIYSHDMSRHTCTFWLRGRCKEVDSGCKFFHGFGEPGEAWEEVKEEYESYYGTEGVEGHYGAAPVQQGFEGGEYEGEAGVLEWGGQGYEPHEEISQVP
ncbi:hypothetical protein TrVE_jg11482 [Triparma verrucosa]|uniref:C3H1-type domain-containing protein n=1 Tax=Triparma verrucosa TaxID=1606542 RepID=A0A9W7F4E4_9STRA|nr:hypothetical protein TrVE_jg11482 [Triparma verrucosa]